MDAAARLREEMKKRREKNDGMKSFVNQKWKALIINS
jgi:hypothetical protein